MRPLKTRRVFSAAVSPWPTPSRRIGYRRRLVPVQKAQGANPISPLLDHRSNVQPEEAHRAGVIELVRILQGNPRSGDAEMVRKAQGLIEVRFGAGLRRRGVGQQSAIYQPGDSTDRVRKAKGDPQIACYNANGELIGLADPDDLVEVATVTAVTAKPSGPQYSPEALAAQAASAATQSGQPVAKGLRGEADALALASRTGMWMAQNVQVRKSLVLRGDEVPLAILKKGYGALTDAQKAHFRNEREKCSSWSRAHLVKLLKNFPAR